MFMENNRGWFLKWKKEITIFSCGISIGILFMYLMVVLNVVKPERTKYVYVDVEQIITAVNQNLNQEIEAKHIGENQIDEKLTKAKVQFDLILENYPLKNNAVVISSHKVIAGAENITKDITDEILARIK
jgi:sugar-specific transcriptional regulator TrmB